MYSTTQRMNNSLRTFVLMAGLAALLVGVGYMIGGSGGLMVFVVIAVAMNFAMYWFSGPMALKMARAREVSAAEEPELHRMIGELARRAGVPMPKVYVTPDEQANAFATGRNPKHAAIAVTAGIRTALPPDELEGVLAHEMAHVKNRDILIASAAAMIAGAIGAVVNVLQFSMLFGGGDDEDSGPLGAFGALIAVVFASLAATVIQLAISRQREYRADATGAQLLGDPLPLADALVRLQHGAQMNPMPVREATASLYIVNPFGGMGRQMAGWFSTHPPMDERVRRLRAMAGSGAGFTRAMS